MSNGKRINLFREKKKPKKKVDDKVFDMMTSVSDKTDVNINDNAEIPKNRESIHNALMVAGMTPGIGNIADITDATLYALEGEFGNAAWSAAAAIPIIGQMVSAKKALKAAKEAGEEVFTLYRGVEKWYPGTMVKEGKFLSPKSKGIYVANDKGWVNRAGYTGGQPGIGTIGKDKKGFILEFEVPKSWFDKAKKTERYGTIDFPEGKRNVGEFFIDEGIPKEFLKKIHK